MKKMSQVIVRKTVTYVISSELLGESSEGVSSNEAWDMSSSPEARIVYSDNEVLAVESADWVCLGCLADLALRGTALGVKIVMAENGDRPTISYDNLDGLKLECSRDCGVKVDPDREKTLLEQLS